MNDDILKGKWHQLKGQAKETWGELTDDDLDKVDGQSERLVGVLQERYGKSVEEAKQAVERWKEKVA
ncbi:MAG: UPF0337 protein [Lysobacteraceae bacterium]|nr:MAG: UPF0337 protein [Xanthomonadaceae bacterium]